MVWELSWLLKTTLLRTSLVEINTMALQMSQGRDVLSSSLFSSRKRMTTDVFICRRVCRFYLKTTRNYSSFKQTFPSCFFGRKSAIFFSFFKQVLLVFHRKDVAKNKYKNRGWWGWKQEEKHLLFFFLKRNLLILEINTYFACNLYKGGYAGVCFDISKWDKKPKK